MKINTRTGVTPTQTMTVKVVLVEQVGTGTTGRAVAAEVTTMMAHIALAGAAMTELNV